MVLWKKITCRESIETRGRKQCNVLMNAGIESAAFKSGI